MRSIGFELKRAFSPEEVGAEGPCGICGVPFVTGTVSASVVSDDIEDVCPSCVEYLGRRNPGRFPSLEEYEEANRLYTEPMYASEEEIARLEEADDPSVHEAYWASWLKREDLRRPEFDEERMLELIRRADSFNNARVRMIDAIKKSGGGPGSWNDIRKHVFPVLRREGEAAQSAAERYRQALGA